MDAKIGDIKFYHEEGCRWKVEVLDAIKKEYGNSPGEEYKLRLIEVISPSRFGDEPKKGLEFSVWKAENSGGYTGWHLLDR